MSLAKTLISLAGGLALVSVAGLALTYWLQPSFVYFPSRIQAGTPADQGLDYQPVSITTSDGETLSAWFVPAPNSRGVVLFLHGNAGNISHRLGTLAHLQRLQMSTLIIDYRGYGASTGRISEPGSYLDARASWRYLTETRAIDPTRIVILGRSLGGGVAIQLATEVPAAGLVIESSFTSIGAMGRHYYPFLPPLAFQRVRYPSIERIASIGCPLLLAHGPEDETVPFSQGLALFERALAPKQFFQLQGPHSNGAAASGAPYSAALSAFFNAALSL